MADLKDRQMNVPMYRLGDSRSTNGDVNPKTAASNIIDIGQFIMKMRAF